MSGLSRIAGQSTESFDISTITAIIVLSGPATISAGILIAFLGSDEWGGLMTALGIFLAILVASSYLVIWGIEKV